MDKKAYVLKVLELVKDTLPLAAGFYVMIEKTQVSDETLDLLINIFSNTINQINDEKTKNKLEKSRDFLEEIKNQELREREVEKEDINKLDEMLSNI